MPVDGRGDTVKAERVLEAVRCRECRKLLCKTSASPLRPSEVIEIKCATCNTMNYLMGRP